MSENDSPSQFIKNVEEQSKRKLSSKKHPDNVWFGLGMMGLIGWSIIVPTLLGAVIGSWLDKNHTNSKSWTLALIVGGLSIGCLNAWHWMSRQHQNIRDQQGNDDDGN